jgi:16S rRNA (cytosine1402-N4)-methyltransferase
MPHIPVLLQEMIEFLKPQQNGIHLDCTFGAGGYARKILENGGIVYACDQDSSTKQYFDILNSEYPNRIFFYHTNFTKIDNLLKQDGIEELDGIVMDLGISSMQIDDGSRGFSFNKDARLDMRMDSSSSKTAEDFVNYTSQEDIADVLYYYGDERDARKIARAIVNFREKEKIISTLQLANIVQKSIKFKPNQKIHPATKTFQAIRIFINDEINNLITALQKLCTMLKVGASMIAVSFHSLEDRVVKKFFSNLVTRKIDNNYILLNPDFYAKYSFKAENKVIIPTAEELSRNIRARSAKMRVLRRI